MVRHVFGIRAAGRMIMVCALELIDEIMYVEPFNVSSHNVPVAHLSLYAWSPQLGLVLNGYGTLAKPQSGHCSLAIAW